MRPAWFSGFTGILLNIRVLKQKQIIENVLFALFLLECPEFYELNLAYWFRMLVIFCISLASDDLGRITSLLQWTMEITSYSYQVL